MPTRYTFEQVKNTFAQSGCTLLEETYTNQLEKLKYIASCGHENTTSFKQILKGSGIKCFNCALNFATYETISKSFEDKLCKLCYTKEEFDAFYINNKQKLKYIAACGHENVVCYKNFSSLNQGTNCPSCVNKNTGIILKNLRTGPDRVSSIEQEFNCIKYFTDLVKDKFIIKKTFDGCKADIVIKPLDSNENLWLGIQVKSTHVKTEREQYYFRLNNSNYDNCLLLCICETDKKIWLIPYEDVVDQKTIGIAKKSKYNKYEITEKLHENIQHFYVSLNKFCFETLNIPTSDNQKQEQSYRNYREKKIDFIEFKNNEIEGLVYDFMINDKRVQEKVGCLCKPNNPDMFSFHLSKFKCVENGKHVLQNYQEGDNALYWLNCKNNKFYVIPESVLIEKGLVGKNSKKQHLYVSPTNKNTEWCNAYLFDYDDLDKDHLLQIINN
jgi:hypothetical protein